LFPLKVSQFLIGILLAFAMSKPRKGSERWFIVLFTLLIAEIKGGPLFVAIVTLLALVLVVGDSGEVYPGIGLVRGLRRALSCRLATFFADVSYGVYLIHLLFLIPIMAYFVRFDWFIRIRP